MGWLEIVDIVFANYFHKVLLRQTFDVLSLQPSASSLLFQIVDNLLHILGEFRVKLNVFTVCRVNKAECLGMKSLTAKRFYQRFQLGIFQVPKAGIAAVNRVRKERMSGFGEVNPDLMSPSGLQSESEQCDTAVSGKHLPVGDCVPAMLCFTGHFLAVSGVPTNLILYTASFGFW
jgi:hypothetical protein